MVEVIEYRISRETCQKNIDKLNCVCEGCGNKLEPIETVDNSKNPTFWAGCVKCSCFRGGVEGKYFKVARQMVESGEFAPHGHMSRHDYEQSEECLNYYYDTQTAYLSTLVRRIDWLLRELEAHVATRKIEQSEKGKK